MGGGRNKKAPQKVSEGLFFVFEKKLKKNFVYFRKCTIFGLSTSNKQNKVAKMTHFTDKQINESFTAEQVEAIEYILAYFSYRPNTKRYLKYRNELVFHTVNKSDTVIRMANERGFKYQQ